MEGYSIPFNENYFKRRGKGSSYTEEYWYESERIFQYFIKRLKIIEDYIKRSKTIADIGCGLAHSSCVARLINPSVRVIAVDIAEAALNRAIELYGSDPGIDFVVADATMLPMRSDSLDLVVSFELYEHLEAPTRMIKEIHRVLKPGGFLFLTTPNARSLGAIIKGDRWVTLQDETHIGLTSPEQLKANLARVGFNIVKCITHGFPILNTIEKILNRILHAPLGLGAEIIVVAEKRS